MTTSHHITAQQLAHNEGLTIHTMPSMASMIELLDIGSEADAYEPDTPEHDEDMQAYHELLKNEIVDF